jgi:hypothetical protein
VAFNVAFGAEDGEEEDEFKTPCRKFRQASERSMFKLITLLFHL